MTQFYASRYMGTGTEEDPFRPIAQQAATDNGVASGALDFRPDGSTDAGWALVAVALANNPPNLPAGVHHLGDSVSETAQSIKDFLANRFNITALADEPDLRRIIRRLLLREGREDGTRWRGLRSSWGRRADGSLAPWREYRIRMLDFLDQVPVVQGGAVITDAFNRSNNTNIGSNWTEVFGDFFINNNGLENPSGTGYARHNTALDTDDHYAQAAIGDATANESMLARCDTNADATANFYMVRVIDTTGNRNIFKRVNGSFTMIADDAPGTFPYPATLRIEANGSDISLLLDGAEELAATDTAITGNLRTGVRAAPGGRWDDFEAGDLAAAVQRIIAGAGSFPATGAVVAAN